MDEDAFDSLLNLEDDYYNDGYRLGVEDGSRAGRIEGRVFGLEKGFEKFVEIGQLNGKACVWAARMQQKTSGEVNSLEQKSQSDIGQTLEEDVAPKSPTRNGRQVTLLPSNIRLDKHISTLYALSEAESLSTENTEDAVSEFDDRFKRAQSKAKVIENIIKERNVDVDADSSKSISGNKHRVTKVTRAATSEKNMEDFGVPEKALLLAVHESPS